MQQTLGLAELFMLKFTL